MNRRRLALASLLAVSLAATLACERAAPAPPAPRLVVLYAPCTVQKLQLSPYSPDVPFTPSLAAFARESWVFERHTTEAAQSGTAFASIFSGAQADRHGVYHHPRKLPGELYLMAEAFADGGYETWYWSGHPTANAALDYGQGVPSERVRATDGADDGSLAPEEALARTANEPELDRVLERLRSDPELRVFVQVNFTVTHGPYSHYTTPEAVAAFCERFPECSGGLAPDVIWRWLEVLAEHHSDLQWNYAATVEQLGLGEAERAELSAAVEVGYRTTIHELDRLFGQFVERIKRHGLWEESLVAFTSDHGEVLDRDNAMFKWTHELQLAPEELDVPWIVHVPGPDAAPRAWAGVTRSIDVYPTLAGLAGIRLPAGSGVAGVDLSAALRGEADPPELEAYSHTVTFGRRFRAQSQAYPLVLRYFGPNDVSRIWVRLRSGDLVCKLRSLEGGGFGTEVFDLASDPEERRNVYSAADARHEEMRAKLEAYKAHLVDAHARRSEPAPLSEEAEVELLKSLGYVK
ncbi:MAG TPA: sulfatase-like hydrolase/transferase [Myxococcota bacterium]|nr:sulfatase-like hydrolase/transferase [Myxococcota bacterium]